MGVTVRRAGLGDLSGVLALYRHLHPEDPAVNPERARTTWAAIVGSGVVTMFVAEAGDTLVSTCMLLVTPILTYGARPFAGPRTCGCWRLHYDRGCRKDLSMQRHAMKSLLKSLLNAPQRRLGSVKSRLSGFGWPRWDIGHPVYGQIGPRTDCRLWSVNDREADVRGRRGERADPRRGIAHNIWHGSRVPTAPRRVDVEAVKVGGRQSRRWSTSPHGT